MIDFSRGGFLHGRPLPEQLPEACSSVWSESVGVVVKMSLDHAGYEEIAVVITLMTHHLKTLPASETGVA